MEAKNNKYDGFYTNLVDIENELKHYWPELEGKKIWCNCDDPEWSAFYTFFFNQKDYHDYEIRFSTYELEPENKSDYTKIKLDKPWIKKDPSGKIKTYQYMWVDQDGYAKGDFRAKEQIALWKWADVIITNPPLSLIKEFISYITKYDKKYLLIAPQIVISYKEIYNLIINHNLWHGINYYISSMNKIEKNKEVPLTNREARLNTWLTNLQTPIKDKASQILSKWDHKKFVKYDNYDAYETVWWYGEKKLKKASIPFTDKVLGVPLSFLQLYNPKQFEILGRSTDCTINGIPTYIRLFVKLKPEWYEKNKQYYLGEADEN